MLIFSTVEYMSYPVQHPQSYLLLNLIILAIDSFNKYNKPNIAKIIKKI
jgi:hypothetical protein